MQISYTRRTEERVDRIDRILKSMQVPNREYAGLIAAATKEGSRAEKEWIEVYNETCFDG